MPINEVDAELLGVYLCCITFGMYLIIFWQCVHAFYKRGFSTSRTYWLPIATLLIFIVTTIVSIIPTRLCSRNLLTIDCAIAPCHSAHSCLASVSLATQRTRGSSESLPERGESARAHEERRIRFSDDHYGWYHGTIWPVIPPVLKLSILRDRCTGRTSSGRQHGCP